MSAVPNSSRKATGRRRGGTVEFIVEDTSAAIRSGRLALGQRLIEADMMRDLSVSRGSLREAFNRLSASGLIEIVPNRGAVVRRLSRKEVADLFAIRIRLEGLAAALAARSIHEGDNRTRLSELLVSHAPPGAASLDEYRRENYVVHGTIADLSGNGQIVPMIRQLWLPAVMAELRGSLDHTFWRQSSDDHRRIIEAILAADDEGAETAMRIHLEARCEVILSLPARVFGE